MKKKCPNCGAIVESKFCTSCGHDLTGPEIIKICPDCGTETASKFCTGCGRKLIDEPTEVKKQGIPPTSVVAKASPVGKAEAIIAEAKKAEETTQRKEREAEERKKQKEAEQRRLEELKAAEERKRKLEKERKEAEERKKQQEAEQRRLEELKAEEERKRQLEKERKEAQEREESEKKKKAIQQKKTYEEALAYMGTASQADDHGVAAQFYRKAEELFSSIPGVEEAGEKALEAARKAKEQEIFLEAKRIKAEQEAKAAEEKARQEAAAEAAKREAEETALKAAAAVNPDKTADSEQNAPTEVATEDRNVQPLHEEVIGAANDAPERGAGEPAKPEGKSKSKIIIAVAVIAAIALIGAIFGLTHGGSDEEEAVSEETVIAEQEDNEDTAKSGKYPIEIYSDDNGSASITGATYTTGASDISLGIRAVNNTKGNMNVILGDVVIDDANIRVDYDGSDYDIEEGDWETSLEIPLDKLVDAGVTDFKKLTCVYTVNMDGKEVGKKEIAIDRKDISDVEVNLSGNKVDNSDKTIEISRKNLQPTIVANDKYDIDVMECTYNKGETDPYISLSVENATKQLMIIDMEDVKVDDSSVKPLFEGEEDPVYAGEWYTGLYLSLENLQAAGVEDFKDVYFTMVVKVGDKEELRQKVHITRDAFQEE